VFTISKTFEFSAAHALVNLPPDHQCARFHGHNYVVQLTLASEDLDRIGFVRDYGELRTFKRWVDDTLDHRWLGYGKLSEFVGQDATSEQQIVRNITEPVFPFNPTAENMARHIYDFAGTLYPELASVGISETPKTWAYYRRD
jgi:6-pyruvoyltetrahydropterin/6-carboxytetrahydropterin synthase